MAIRVCWSGIGTPSSSDFCLMLDSSSSLKVFGRRFAFCRAGQDHVSVESSVPWNPLSSLLLPSPLFPQCTLGEQATSANLDQTLHPSLLAYSPYAHAM
jgi:hypothetical protein